MGFVRSSKFNTKVSGSEKTSLKLAFIFRYKCFKRILHFKVFIRNTKSPYFDVKPTKKYSRQFRASPLCSAFVSKCFFSILELPMPKNNYYKKQDCSYIKAIKAIEKFFFWLNNDKMIETFSHFFFIFSPHAMLKTKRVFGVS